MNHLRHTSDKKYDNLVGGLFDNVTSTACFGDKACKEQRDIDQERQRLELDLLRRELEDGGTSESGGLSTGTLIGIAVAMLVFLFIIIIIAKRKKSK